MHEEKPPPLSPTPSLAFGVAGQRSQCVACRVYSTLFCLPPGFAFWMLMKSPQGLCMIVVCLTCSFPGHWLWCFSFSFCFVPCLRVELPREQLTSLGFEILLHPRSCLEKGGGSKREPSFYVSILKTSWFVYISYFEFGSVCFIE